MAATAEAAEPISPRPRVEIRPSGYDRSLAAGALAMLAVALVALVRGRAHWSDLTPFIWTHLLTVMLALALTPVMMLRRRGDRWHRRLGYAWVAALAVTALASFGIRGIMQGSLGPIHLLSAWTLLNLPVLVLAARSHNLVRHRAIVRGIATGGLIIAGLFTLPFGRTLGVWLFG